ISDPKKLESMARALLTLGTERAWIVHGADGLDEVTLADATYVGEVHNGQMRTFKITPEEFGLKRANLDSVRGGDAVDNAGIIREILAGRRRDEARSLVLINSAAALHVGDFASDLREAMAL